MDLCGNGDDSDQNIYYSADSDSGMSDNDDLGSDYMSLEGDDEDYRAGSDKCITDWDDERDREPSKSSYDFVGMIRMKSFWQRFLRYPASRTGKHAHTESSDKIITPGSDMSITDDERAREPSKPSYGGHEYDDFVGTTSFWQRYLCYPASKTEKHAHTESSDKIIMPQSALDVLSSLNIGYPMLFEFRPYSFDAAKNDKTEKFRVSHCGVWEFTAEEGSVYMPSWMMKNMNLKEGDLVLFQNQTLPKGTHVKLQTHTKDFLDIPNPKAMLEAALRTFSCLTTGDTIVLPYGNKKYYMDIIETKPAYAIGIIDTDCEVDFAPPLDYKEPEKPVAVSIPLNKEAADQVEEPKFSAFKGTGRRLDGKPWQYEALDSFSFNAANGDVQPCKGSRSRVTSPRAQGKLVFGSEATPTAPKVASIKVKQQQRLQEKEEPKFQAFTGKMYTLA